LVSKVSEKKLLLILESLTKLSATPKDDQLRDIANLGLRTVIKEISPNSTLGTSATTKLTPSLLEQLNDKAVTQETMLNNAELLLELFSRFESS
jgi:cullin-associated NEDD8-dissociated protein 1